MTELTNGAAYGAADVTEFGQCCLVEQEDIRRLCVLMGNTNTVQISASYLAQIKRTIHGYRRNNRSGGRSFYQEHYRQKEKGHTERWESYLPDASHEEEDRRRDRNGHTRYGEYAGNDHERGNRLERRRFFHLLLRWNYRPQEVKHQAGGDAGGDTRRIIGWIHLADIEGYYARPLGQQE